ncbi:MAG: hypothetical protein JRN54_10195 [Nitrososphaerota archaeon]|nr:hypothetical protein [Nitrososphaerota archaeon]
MELCQDCKNKTASEDMVRTGSPEERDGTDTEECTVILRPGEEPELQGPCAEAVNELAAEMWKESERKRKEMAVLACLMKGRRHARVVGVSAGESTSVSLPDGEPCDPDELRAILHTHPVSGAAQLSPQDKKTYDELLGTGKVDLAGVVGKEGRTRNWVRGATVSGAPPPAPLILGGYPSPRKASSVQGEARATEFPLPEPTVIEAARELRRAVHNARPLVRRGFLPRI